MNLHSVKSCYPLSITILDRKPANNLCREQKSFVFFCLFSRFFPSLSLEFRANEAHANE